MRAVQLPGVAGASRFLVDFGRPDRLLACECERGKEVTLNQAFQMISGESITRKVQESPRIQRLLDAKASNEDIPTDFYLAALSRYPTAKEVELISARLDRAKEAETNRALVSAVLAARNEELDAIKNSTIWRITAPVRIAGIVATILREIERDQAEPDGLYELRHQQHGDCDITYRDAPIGEAGEQGWERGWGTRRVRLAQERDCLLDRPDTQ